MFEELFGNCPQSKVLDFLFSAPVEEYTKQQIAVASGISRFKLDNVINDFVENGIIFHQNSGYILNAESELVSKLDAAQEEFIKFNFNKQLQDGAVEYEELSDESIDNILDKIPDYLDFDELEKEIEYPEDILKEYECLKDGYRLDFSLPNREKYYTVDLIE